MLNRQVGRYTLKKRIASGGMGEIYLAETSGAANFSKQVAIKCILPHLAKNTDFVQKFIDEANLMVQLQHGAIVPVIELFEEDGLLYLVMEYVPGRDLKAVIREMKRVREFIPEAVSIWIVQQLCDALGYAHEKRDANGEPLGIIHRDVSPSNIILSESGAVKLLDFGIAKARSRVHQSVSGTLQGKFIYMSPEQADGRSMDRRSDLFSLGLILYELLTHVRPFEGDGEPEILRNARECNISPPSHYRPELSSDLDQVVMRALQKDPEQRYESAFEFHLAASEYLSKNELHPSSGALVSFLSGAFPKGIVETSPPPIQTVDDALLQQINALTPSFAGVARSTVTKDDTLTLLPPKGQVAKESNIHEQPFSEGESTFGKPQTNKTRRKFWWLVAVFMALVIGLVVRQSLPSLMDTTMSPTDSTNQQNDVAPSVSAPASEPEHRGKFEFSFKGVSAADVTLTVDNASHAFGASLPLGRTYLICAQSKGFEVACQRSVLEKSLQPIVFQLNRYPSLSPTVVGVSDEYEITVNEVIESQFPMRLSSGKSYRVCARSRMASNSPKCIRINAQNDHYRPEFRLEPIAAPTSPKAAIPKRPMSLTPQRQQTIISSIPVADVYRNGKRLGTTPFAARQTLWGKRLSLRAKGYINTTFSLPKQPKSTYRVNLKRPGYLTVRVTPPASSIFVDGRRVGTGFLKRFPIAPGMRTIEAVFSTSGGQKNRWGPQKFTVIAGQEKHLKHIIVKRSRSAEP